MPAAAKTPALDAAGKEVLAEKDGEPGSRLAEVKAVTQVLAQPNRNSVLLETGSDALLKEVLAGVAQLMKAKDAPEGLRGKKLTDVSGGEYDGKKQGESDAERLQALLSEAAAAKNVILVLPALVKQGQGGKISDWATG